MIKVLVVEDSAVVREFLVHLLAADPAIQVIGTASSGEEALEAVVQLRPDIITMDINLPKMNGFETTRRIMETSPTPIVIVSGSWAPQEVAPTFRAVEAGALAVLPRPSGVSHPGHEKMARELVQTIKLLSEVKVVRRWAPRQRVTAAALAPSTTDAGKIAKVRVVAMGASTGGPAVLRTILAGLAEDFPVPVVIVQHMAAGFIHGFAEWLAQASRRPVSIATDGELLRAGHTYIAPDAFQMKIEAGGRVALTQDEIENGLRPSITYLFRSVATVYEAQAVGVLLTGMGKDGAEQLKVLRDKGAITLVQDKESSIVYGMPGEAIRLNAASHILPPEEIGALLNAIANGSYSPGLGPARAKHDWCS